MKYRSSSLTGDGITMAVAAAIQIRVRFAARTLFVRFKHCQNLPYRL